MRDNAKARDTDAQVTMANWTVIKNVNTETVARISGKSET